MNSGFQSYDSTHSGRPSEYTKNLTKCRFGHEIEL